MDKKLIEFVQNYDPSDEFYGIEKRGINEIRELVEDFLEEYYDEQEKDFKYYEDFVNERADNQVVIYDDHLLSTVGDYKYFIEEFVNEYGCPSNDIIIKLAQGGQYMYYMRLIDEALQELIERIDE